MDVRGENENASVYVTHSNVRVQLRLYEYVVGLVRHA